MLWRRALRCSPAPAKAEHDAHDGLVHVLVTALADLFALRGDNELAAAALRILFDPRLAAWYGATTADASRPPRVATATQRLLVSLASSPCGSLGVSACQPPLCARRSKFLDRTVRLGADISRSPHALPW